MKPNFKPTRRQFCATGLASAAGLLLPGLSAEGNAESMPSRRWTIFVIQHSHIDIGYTEKQEIIADQHAQFIRQAVHVRTATLSEFSQHLEQHAKDLPVHRGEWTDWWSDGVAATPLDTLVFRHAQRTRHVLDLHDDPPSVPLLVTAKRSAARTALLRFTVSKK